MTVTSDSDNVNKVPPDGGYGWVVMFSYALTMMVTLPLYFGFGLVFKEAISDVGLSHSQGSLVLVLNGNIGMLISFLGGPLLRKFGYRKVAVTGAVFASLGLLITAFGTSFWMFILSYSIINSIGVSAAISGSSLAINSFFKEKRGRAIGVAISVMGLGAIVMPQLISGLLTAFGWRYAVLTLSAICLHSLAAACLLRPVKWYLKYPIHSEEIIPLKKGLQSEEDAALSTKSTSMISSANVAILQERKVMSHHSVIKHSSEALTCEDQHKWWASQEINLGSSINIFFNEQDRKVSDVKDKVSVKKEQPKSFFKKFVDMFDLTLLNDPIFVNICFGMAMVFCAENNFFLLLPLILHDMMQFETEEIARLMSIVGVTDTIFRFVTPFIGEWCKQPPRVMYLGGLFLFIIINTTMLYISSFMGMVFLAVFIGISKGFRLVYMNIITPSYVPLERLPFAWGLQMFINGVAGIFFGSMIGRLRETSGAYRIPVVALSVITMLTILAWSAEFLYFKIKNKKKLLNKNRNTN